MATIRHSLAYIALLTPLLASAQERPLTPDDVSATWVNKVAIGATTTGTPVELRLQADGTAAVVAGRRLTPGHGASLRRGFVRPGRKSAPIKSVATGVLSWIRA